MVHYNTGHPGVDDNIYGHIVVMGITHLVVASRSGGVLSPCGLPGARASKRAVFS